MWARWQLAHPGALFQSSAPGAGLNDQLMEWPDRTPAHVLDHRALGYCYGFEELGKGSSHAVARLPFHLDVFWARQNGAIGTQWWDSAPGQNWNDHAPFRITPPGVAQPGSPVAAVARLPFHLDVFWVQPDGAIGTQWWDAAPGQDWNNHQPFPITSSAASG